MTSEQLQQPFFSPENYRWEQSSSNTNTVERRGNGAEAIVGLKDSNSKGQFDLYIAASLRILPAAPSLTLGVIREKLQARLLELRFLHPEIACTVAWDEHTQTPPRIQYTPPKDHQAALAWAKELVHVRATPLTALEVRTEIEERRRVVLSKRIGDVSAKPFTAYIIADVVNEDSQLIPGTVVDMLLHMNHLYWDGTSARKFAGDLLLGLNQSPSTEAVHYAWGQETSNLSVPILDTMSVDVASLGESFVASYEEFLGLLHSSSKSWGLKPKVEAGVPRTLFHTFTVSESDAMIRAVKSRLGPGYTLTHLGHAAFVLSVLKMNPTSDDTPESKALVMTVPMNCRRYMLSEYASDYYSLSQSNAVVTIDNIKSYMINSSDRNLVLKTLEKASQFIKASIDYWVNKPFQLALGVAKDNFIAEKLSSNLVPAGEMTVPMFISDGINDRFIPHDIENTATGEKVMSIEKFNFFLDQYLPFIAVRMESWKGATTLSICYSDKSHTLEEVSTFLEDIAKYMLEFI